MRWTQAFARPGRRAQQGLHLVAAGLVAAVLGAASPAAPPASSGEAPAPQREAPPPSVGAPADPSASTGAAPAPTAPAPAAPRPGEPVLGGTRYHCLGQGLRRTFGFRIYAVAYCLDADAAQRVVDDYVQRVHAQAHGEALARDLERDQKFFDALMAADGNKMIVLRFMRDISATRLSSAFRDSLKDVVPAGDADRVAAALRVDVRDGQIAVMRSRGRALVMQLASHSQVFPDEPEVAERIWQIWLGADSSTPSLKRSIARRAAGLK